MDLLIKDYGRNVTQGVPVTGAEHDGALKDKLDELMRGQLLPNAQIEFLCDAEFFDALKAEAPEGFDVREPPVQAAAGMMSGDYRDVPIVVTGAL